MKKVSYISINRKAGGEFPSLAKLCLLLLLFSDAAFSQWFSKDNINIFIAEGTVIKFPANKSKIYVIEGTVVTNLLENASVEIANIENTETPYLQKDHADLEPLKKDIKKNVKRSKVKPKEPEPTVKHNQEPCMVATNHGSGTFYFPFWKQVASSASSGSWQHLAIDRVSVEFLSTKIIEISIANENYRYTVHTPKLYRHFFALRGPPSQFIGLMDS